MDKHVEQLDFFEIKLLENKYGTLIVRKGKAYIYVGSDKYHLLEGEVNEYIPKDEDPLVGAKPFKMDQDRKWDGKFFIWQNDDKFVLVFFDITRKQLPLILRAGSALNSL